MKLKREPNNQKIHSAVIRHDLTNVIVKGINKQGRLLVSEIIVGTPAKKSSSKAIGRSNDSLLAPMIRLMRDYLNGLVVDFSTIPLDLGKVSKFQETVLLAARRIPYGKTVSYSMLAKTAGFPRAIRAVATVMRKNHFPIIIPCHRVIRKNGSSGAYGGDWHGEDAALKRTLIKMEKDALNRYKKSRWDFYGKQKDIFGYFRTN